MIQLIQSYRHMCVQLFGCHIDVNATIIPGNVAVHLLSVGILLLLVFGIITHDYIAMTDAACVCCTSDLVRWLLLRCSPLKRQWQNSSPGGKTLTRRCEASVFG